ncbi:MAG: hypothetical protein PHG60_00720 [Candidatus Dojkabacteria bacterium]|jgi:hypothetical protein|nr:hypothetical protein [Candidatus Dojkabacteria bacterium]MDD2270098.1 hypothetical protein [Candidatus Dojkabacteria bacterium]
MSRREERSFKNFLVQEGYLLAFTLIAGLSLLSYFGANNYFARQNGMEVLGTSSVSGVWVQSGSYGKGGIERSYFDKYKKVPMQELYFDEKGEVAFFNENLSITAVLKIKEFINDDVWSNLYIGNLNLKINDKQWVFESVVWDKEGDSSLISLANIGEGYLIALHPSISLTGREKQFWVFEYLTADGVARPLSFVRDDEQRAFIDSTYAEFLDSNGTFLVKFERDDPSLIDRSEVALYKYGTDLEYFKSLLVNRE